MDLKGEELAGQYSELALYDILEFAKTNELNAYISFETLVFDNTEGAIRALQDGKIDCVFPLTMISYEGETLCILLQKIYLFWKTCPLRKAYILPLFRFL